MSRFPGLFSLSILFVIFTWQHSKKCPPYKGNFLLFLTEPLIPFWAWTWAHVPLLLLMHISGLFPSSSQVQAMLPW
jgi:hypothetical protein